MRQRVLGVLGILAIVVAAAVGALPAGAASPDVSAGLAPLLGNSQFSTSVPTVTYGQTAAWQITLANSPTSPTINHVVLTDTVTNATFLSTDNPACVPSSPTKVVCTISQMAAGTSFSARVSFTTTTDTSQTQVGNTLTGTYAPQTTATDTNKRNNTTDTITPIDQPATLDPTSVGTTISTYGFPTSLDPRPTNKGKIFTATGLSATNPQYTEVDLPTSIFGGFGTPVKLSELTGGPCTTCVPVQSLIAIPDSEGLDPTKDPFYNGLTLAPYSWSIQVDGSLVPNGFKVNAVYHDGIALPLCSKTPISAGSPICVLTLTQDNKTKSLFATGEGITNGAYQFG